MPIITGNCPCCGVRDIDPEYDTDGLCSYCAFFAVPEAVARIAKAKRHHKAPDSEDMIVAAHDPEKQMLPLDVMDASIYGGDIDTMVNVIDFGSV